MTMPGAQSRRRFMTKLGCVDTFRTRLRERANRQVTIVPT